MYHPSLKKEDTKDFRHHKQQALMYYPSKEEDSTDHAAHHSDTHLPESIISKVLNMLAAHSF